MTKFSPHYEQMATLRRSCHCAVYIAGFFTASRTWRFSIANARKTREKQYLLIVRSPFARSHFRNNDRLTMQQVQPIAFRYYRIFPGAWGDPKGADSRWSRVARPEQEEQLEETTPQERADAIRARKLLQDIDNQQIARTQERLRAWKDRQSGNVGPHRPSSPNCTELLPLDPLLGQITTMANRAAGQRGDLPNDFPSRAAKSHECAESG
jgi:hypothetical protein